MLVEERGSDLHRELLALGGTVAVARNGRSAAVASIGRRAAAGRAVGRGRRAAAATAATAAATAAPAPTPSAPFVETGQNQ